MPTVDRLLQRGAQRGARALRTIGEEYRDKRVAVGVSQAEVARAMGVSRSTYTRIEGGDAVGLSIIRASQAAAVLGLDLAVRVYPGGSPLREKASLERLSRFLVHVASPLTCATEVPLPTRSYGVPEQRAWDALITGAGKPTGVELEMRLRDAQALERRLALKRKDDPVRFVLLVANTRSNREVLREYPDLFPSLARLGFAAVTRLLRQASTRRIVWCWSNCAAGSA